MSGADKLLKYVFGFSVLLISFSILYYFVIFLPNKNATEMKVAELLTTQKNQEKCLEIGQKAYEQDKEKLASYADFLFDPQYAYNEKLNTCLYSGGYKKGDDWERWIKDSYTNQKLEGILYFKETLSTKEAEDRMTKQIEDYWKTHKEYFD